MERAALADDLARLSAEHWQRDTLCGAWDVEEVVAHLTAETLDRFRAVITSTTAPSFHTPVCNFFGLGSPEQGRRQHHITGLITSPAAQ